MTVGLVNLGKFPGGLVQLGFPFQLSGGRQSPCHILWEQGRRLPPGRWDARPSGWVQPQGPGGAQGLGCAGALAFLWGHGEAFYSLKPLD